MIDKEKLRYDLAMQAAAVMTLRDNHGNPPDRILGVVGKLKVNNDGSK